MSLPSNTVQVIDDLVRHWIVPPEIMVVDDDDMLLEVIRKMLTSFGLSVKTATSGKNAVEIYQKMYERRFESGVTTHPFDLVFLDMRLPDLSGMEVLEKIRKLWPPQPVVLISGQFLNVTGITEYGPVCIDEKPITIDSVRLALAMHNVRMPASLKSFGQRPQSSQS
jgi:CheY-like chemotaxis protein